MNPNGLTVLLLCFALCCMSIAAQSHEISLTTIPTPSEFLQTYAFGSFHCSELAGCNQGDQISFTFIGANLTESFDPTTFRLYLTAITTEYNNNDTSSADAAHMSSNDNETSATQIYDGIITTFQSDTISITTALTTNETLSFVLVIDYESINDDVIDDDDVVDAFKYDVALEIKYTQIAPHHVAVAKTNTDSSNHHAQDNLVYTATAPIHFKHTPVHEYVAESTHAILTTNLQYASITHNTASFTAAGGDDRTDQSYILNVVLANTTIPTTRLHLRTFGNVRTATAPNSSSNYTPTCTVNGLAMNITVHPTDVGDDDFEYDLRLPLVEIKKTTTPHDGDGAGDDDNHDNDENDDDSASDFYLYPHTDLVLTCDFNFTSRQHHNLPMYIAIGIYPLLSQATPTIYTKDNIPTIIFANDKRLHNLDVIDLLPTSQQDDDTHTSQNHFKQLSLPTYPAPTATDNRPNSQQDDATHLHDQQLPIVYTQYSRQFLTPTTRPQGNVTSGTKGDYHSAFTYKFNIYGDVNVWHSDLEAFRITISQLPTNSEMSYVKYVLYGLSTTKESISQQPQQEKQQEKQQQQQQHYIQLGRGELPHKKIHVERYTNSYTKFSHTAFSIHNFLPHILTKNDYHDHPICQGPCSQGLIEFVMVLKHHQVPFEEWQRYIRNIPQDDGRHQQKIKKAHLSSRVDGDDDDDDDNDDHHVLIQDKGTPHVVAAENDNVVPLHSLEPILRLGYYQTLNRTTKEQFSTQHVYQFEQSYSLVESAESFVVTPHYYSGKANFTTTNDITDVTTTTPTIITTTPTITTTTTPTPPTPPPTTTITTTKIPFVTTDRLYTFDITLHNLSLPHHAESDHFILSAPTGEYSFYGDFKECYINDDVVHPVPYYYNSVLPHHHGHLAHNVALVDDNVATSPMLLFRYKLTRRLNYTISCASSGFLTPTIPYGALEFLWNDNIPLTITLYSTPNVSIQQQPQQQQLGEYVLAQNIIYSATTTIPFQDNLRPNYLTVLILTTIFFTLILIVSIIVWFATKKCCTMQRPIAHNELNCDPTADQPTDAVGVMGGGSEGYQYTTIQ